MKLSFTSHPRKIFIQIFIPFLTIVVCSIVFISAVLYYNFQQIATDMIYKESTVNIESISRDVTKMKEIVSAIAIQAYYDNSVFQLMYYDLPAIDTLPLMNRFKSYKNSFPYLNSMYAYNGKTFYDSEGFSYSKNEFPDVFIVDVLDHIEMYPKSRLVPRFVDNSMTSPNASGYSLVYTFIFYDSYQRFGSIDNALVFNISEKWLSQGLRVTNNNNSRLLILDSSGRTVNTDSVYPARSDLSHLSFVQKVLDASQDSGFFTESIEDKETVITYKTTDIEGWTFISMQPYDNILEKIARIRSRLVLFVSIAMVLGAMMTFFLSRRLFIPVKSMTMDLHKLSIEQRSNLYDDRQALLKNFVMHEVPLNPQQVADYNIQLPHPADGLLMFLLRLDDFKAFCSQYNQVDRSLVKYGIINIGNEAMAQYFSGECIDISDDGILFLLSASGDLAGMKRKTTSLIVDLQKYLKLYLRSTQTYTVARQICLVNDMRQAYNDLLIASEYRMLAGKGGELHEEDIRYRNIEDFLYPSEKEVLLTEAMMLGKSEQAKEVFRDIAHYAALFGRVIFNSGISRLLISINNTILVIQKNHDVSLNYSFNDYLDCILNLETVQEVAAEFDLMFDSVAVELNKFKLSRHEKLMQEVLDYIALNYSSPNMCVNQIAEYVSMTPNYLSKLFKKYKSVSISDYISTFRLEKARAYILNEDTSISTIMTKTGFTSRSHFYTLFKGAYSITPNDLRKGNAFT